LNGPAIDKLEKEWMESHPLVTFNQAVEQAISTSTDIDKTATLEEYKKLTAGKSNGESRQVARRLLGKDVIWSWDRKLSPLNFDAYRQGFSQFRRLEKDIITSREG
jgi:isocitrate lyase